MGSMGKTQCYLLGWEQGSMVRVVRTAESRANLEKWMDESGCYQYVRERFRLLPDEVSVLESGVCLKKIATGSKRTGSIYRRP